MYNGTFKIVSEIKVAEFYSVIMDHIQDHNSQLVWYHAQKQNYAVIIVLRCFSVLWYHNRLYKSGSSELYFETPNMWHLLQMLFNLLGTASMGFIKWSAWGQQKYCKWTLRPFHKTHTHNVQNLDKISDDRSRKMFQLVINACLDTI